MKHLLPAATLLTVAALLTGCGASEPGNTNTASIHDGSHTVGTSLPSIPGEPTAEPAKPSTPAAVEIPDDPKAAGEQFVRTAYTWDATTDTGITDGLQRAKPLATAELAETFVAPERNSGGTKWNDAAKNGAHTVVSVEVLPDGNQALVPASPEHKAAAYMVSWTWQNGDYKRIGGRDLVVLDLVRDADGAWKVNSYSPTPAP